MTPAPQPIDRSFRHCIISGILSLAIPVSGVLVFIAAALAGLALPSSSLNNQFMDVLRIYSGLAFLLPVPLALLTVVFFVNGMIRLHRDPALRGVRAAVIGIAISALSIILFSAIAIFFPQL